MDNNRKLFEGLLKADGIAPEGVSESERIAFSKMLDGQLKPKKSKPVHRPDIWRKIMRSRITRFSTAAMVILAVMLSIMFLDRSVSTAFGIERVIAAYNKVRFLQVRQFKATQEEPLEFWIKSDEQGNITNARYYLPEHFQPEDGAKLATWTPEKAELWFKRKHSYLIFQSKRIEGWMLSLLEQSQPKLVMKKLLENQKAGTVEIDIQEPQEKQKLATITVTYKSKPKKEIYYINQATDLITHIEYYRIEKNQDVLDLTTEFYDYNVSIDEKMFSLKDEIPEDVTVLDQLNQLIGIAQGEMSYEEAAVETVRQFFQALIDKDYPKAGLIFSGISGEKTKEYFGWLNVAAIISVGPAKPYPICGPHSFSVACEVESISGDGEKTIRKFGSVKARCGEDEMHPDRWIIHGGI
ncbi:MAG: hypothetical protein FVQ80_02935 [Planctomycetes bacterium]|nr:hypothetical protein [Planctomycetota bacterium]